MAHDRNKNRYVGPADIQFPLCIMNIGGAPVGFPVLADLPQGGFIQWITGDNPIGMPEPGCHLKPGTMVLMMTPELAEHLRQGLLDAWDTAVNVDISDITG